MLNTDDAALVAQLSQRLTSSKTTDDLLDAYYEGVQRLNKIGLAVPPELEMFETVVNWPRLCVDALAERCEVKSLTFGDEMEPNSQLSEIWEASNMESEFPNGMLDSFIFGRGVASVSANEDDADNPRIAIESPREVVVDIDPRTRLTRYGLRLIAPVEQTQATYGSQRTQYATLYKQGVTYWIQNDGAGWFVIDQDEHNIGRVPLIPLFNRRRTGQWTGVSEMHDAIPLTDAAARSLTNLQVAAETHSVPQKYVLGMSKGDFVDPATDEPLPIWESYFSAIWANGNSDAEVGQFSASDLSNFHSTVEHYAALISGLYSLPARYLGSTTANPVKATDIQADESRLVRRAERKNLIAGEQGARIMAYAYRIATGEWPSERIRVQWHDPSTPTFASKVDGIQKLTGGKPVMSVEGAWDELGWSESRKQLERQRLAAEGAPAGESGAVPLTDSDVARAAAESVQKVYLGVGTVLTEQEAREIVKRTGADIDPATQIA